MRGFVSKFPVITRFAYLPDCTLGWLQIGSARFATIEEPWIPNPFGPGGQSLDKAAGKAASCVPDGTYNLLPFDGTHFKNVYVMVNHALGVYRLPSDIRPNQPFGRSACLWHVGNSTDDIEGCVAIGLRHGMVSGRHWVYDSGRAIDQVRALLGKNQHTLMILPTAGTG